MLKISSRQIIKEAGPKEKKKANGINFEHVRSNLSSGGEEVPRSAIDDALQNESNLVIKNNQLITINDLNLSEDARKRLNSDEAFLIIAGAVLSSDTKDQAEGKLNVFNWYLVTKEISPGSFGITPEKISNINQIKDIFNNEFNKAKIEKEESERASEKANSNGYLSNDIVYDFGDGWKVVYVPAVGEIEGFQGDLNTSHDRVLEGDKNGLCLGSGLRFYQDNSNGKIYSVRDPENKPRVTIRIQEDTLHEAKGKNNNPPDAEGANHAREWFKSDENNSLNYKNNRDYQNFPPGTVEDAKESFNKDSKIPYVNGWISAWYKKGIPELDENVHNRVSDNDPLIISSGIGKKFNKLAEPVVKYWCEKYLSNEKDETESKAENINSYKLKDSDPKSVIFGNQYSPPTHETFKVFRKLPEMIRAVEKLSVEDPEWYCKIGLMEFDEYAKFSDAPMSKFLESKSNIEKFFDNFADKNWGAKYIDLAFNNYIKDDRYNTYSGSFIKKYHHKDWASKYIEPLIDSLYLKNNNFEFASYCLDAPYSEKYIKEIIENEKNISALTAHLDNKFVKKYISQIMSIVLKNKNASITYHILKKYFDDEFLKPYIDDLSNIVFSDPIYALISLEYDKEGSWLSKNYEKLIQIQLDTDPVSFYTNFQDKDWAEPYINTALENSVKTIPSSLLSSITYIGKDTIRDIPTLKRYISIAIENFSERNLQDLIYYIFIGSSFIENEILKDFVPTIMQKAIKEIPKDIISYSTGSHDPVRLEYIDAAAKRLAEIDPKFLLKYCNRYPSAKKYEDYARKNLEALSLTEHRLSILSMLLSDIGFKKEAKYISKLASLSDDDSKYMRAISFMAKEIMAFITPTIEYYDTQFSRSRKVTDEEDLRMRLGLVGYDINRNTPAGVTVSYVGEDDAPTEINVTFGFDVFSDEVKSVLINKKGLRRNFFVVLSLDSTSSAIGGGVSIAVSLRDVLEGGTKHSVQREFWPALEVFMEQMYHEITHLDRDGTDLGDGSARDIVRYFINPGEMMSHSNQVAIILWKQNKNLETITEEDLINARYPRDSSKIKVMNYINLSSPDRIQKYQHLVPEIDLSTIKPRFLELVNAWYQKIKETH